MSSYIGEVSGGKRTVTVNGRPLKPRIDVFQFSPQGEFHWGAPRPKTVEPLGICQLSLAILCDHMGNDMEPPLLAQQFQKVILDLPGGDFELTREEVDEGIRNARANRKKPILRGRDKDGARPGVGGPTVS